MSLGLSVHEKKLFKGFSIKGHSDLEIMSRSNLFPESGKTYCVDSIYKISCL